MLGVGAVIVIAAGLLVGIMGQPDKKTEIENRTDQEIRAMKVTVNIDCTPEEARTFFGLPDVQPMQKAMMQDIEDRMKANLAAMDPETMLNTWLPQGIQNWEQLQKAFWGQFNSTPGGSGGNKD